MDNKSLLRAFAAFAVALPVVTSCSDDKNDPTPEPTPTVVSRYVLATQVETSGNTNNILVTTESLDEGVVTPSPTNGLYNDGATQWIINNDRYMYGIKYNQGNQGTTGSYILNSNGQMEKRELTYNMTRFTTFGQYDNFIMTSSTGDGPTSMADANGNLPKTILINYLNVTDQTYTTNDTQSGKYLAENYVNNGEYVILAGIEQSGSRIFSGLVPNGLSAYGGSNPANVRPGYEDLVKDADGGTGGGSYKKGELSGTQYPDECWVAIYSNEKMTDPILVKTNKISQPCGRMRSQYYQSVWAAENGDVYVFSPSYAKTQTDPRQQTKLPAGVCRIPAGSDKFDDYYCNLEEQSNGCAFMSIFPAGGNYFLLTMYDRPLTQKGFAATKLAIFDAANKKLTYVKNLPENISSFGKTAFTKDGKVYFPINVENEYPAIYSINPATAEAKKGVTVEGVAINGFGFISSEATL